MRSSLALAFPLVLSFTHTAAAASLSNDKFQVEIGANGEISSLKIANDAFPTNYVLNAANAPGQNTADHEWVGELIFSYRTGSGPFVTALTQASSDVRKVQAEANKVTVSYANSTRTNGIKGFAVAEEYALAGEALTWRITLKNTSAQAIEFGDVGLPLPFNEYWRQPNDVIYETRTVYHSFTGQNGSYITVRRPSGVGPFLLMVPDSSTGAGFEYMDAWVDAEHPGSAWAAGGGTPRWSSGLDVFYIHSNAIKRTNRGYLPSTSLTLAPGASETYAFEFFAVPDQDAVQARLVSEGLIDAVAVPGMMFASDMTAKLDLHTTQKIDSLTPAHPNESVIKPLGARDGGHNLYEVHLTHLGQNDVVVSYGGGKTTTLQFYVLEPVGVAIARHSTFMVEKTMPAQGSLAKVFDDWLMDTKSTSGKTGGGGWGDDWGWTHGQFLAEKNAQTPVAAEVRALDEYLDAVWRNAIDHDTFVVQDWWCPAGTSASNPRACFYNRPYAYPHAFNTYFSMYEIAKLYPSLVAYHSPADTYLMRAYGILHSLYSGGPPPPKAPETIAGTGYMGEQTLPDIMRALTNEGHVTEAGFVKRTIDDLHAAFEGSAYPYGSEYSYDNTGEEAVYMAARENGDIEVLRKVNAKTRACRGHQPAWYYYADPVTLNGENWWQFQYTASLAGYCMDDWLRHHSTTPELDERLSYAAKLANIGAINSGQIDADPANIGSVSWTYQAMKGNVYVGSFEPDGSKLHNGWRQMAGEADLGLFGALRILSTDVAVDPVFGLIAYGGDVAQTGDCYGVTPRDGVFKRLNLVTQKLYVALGRDRYSAATVSTHGDYVRFTLQNQTGDAHTTALTLEGLAPGAYDVKVDGAAAPALDIAAGQVATVLLPITAAATQEVTIATPNATCAGVVVVPPDDTNPGPGGAAGAANGSGASNSGGASNGVTGGTTAGGAAGTANAGTSPGGGQGTVDAGGPGKAGAGSSSGCDCRVAQSSERPWVAIGALAAALVRRRRRYGQ
jgi:MYXO-CTERM domain-containing protein